MTLSATAEQQGTALANTAHEAISELCIDNAHIQHAGWTSSLASARPVYYYSVFPETLQINGVCTTPGKALGFELIPLPGGCEIS